MNLRELRVFVVLLMSRLETAASSVTHKAAVLNHAEIRAVVANFGANLIVRSEAFRG